LFSARRGAKLIGAISHYVTEELDDRAKTSGMKAGSPPKLAAPPAVTV
jgi:hypothetical protein